VLLTQLNPSLTYCTAAARAPGSLRLQRPLAASSLSDPASFTHPPRPQALTGLTLREDVLEKERTQAEFTRTIWDYLDRAVSAERIAAGRAGLAKHGDILGRIAARSGVDPQIVVAIWGLESNYGALRGDVPTIAALATSVGRALALAAIIAAS
jgi:membrane-bound lytic murein transglycosylase B